jgi:hypothetical protein
MCGRRRHVALLFGAIWIAAAAVPNPAVSADMVDLDAIAMRSSAIDAAAARIRHDRCRTAMCQAIVAISTALDIVGASKETTMGDARILPPDRDRIVEGRWRRLLPADKTRAAALCQAATNFVSRYADHDGGDGAYVVEVLIELAFRLDHRNHQSCLPAVLAALKPGPDSDEMIGYVRKRCLYTMKLGSECEEIGRD